MSDSTFPWELKLLLAGAFALIGLALALAVGPLIIRMARHARWAFLRWRDRRGHGGDLLEALARKIEGPLL
jgi:hypothetical protein